MSPKKAKLSTGEFALSPHFQIEAKRTGHLTCGLEFNGLLCPHFRLSDVSWAYVKQKND